MPNAVDLRIFRNPNALGLLNAAAGYIHVDPNAHFLVSEPWMQAFLQRQNIPSERILTIHGLRGLLALRGWTIILPLQRARLDTSVLWMLGFLTLKTFVHDLHFLSRRPLLAVEFRGASARWKRLIYLFFIKHADAILVDSRLVQRQVKILFGRNSTHVPLTRVFSRTDVNAADKGTNDISHDFDYFLPLSGRPYKGSWALSRLVFQVPNARVLVDTRYYDEAIAALGRNNPSIKIMHRDLRPESALIEAFKTSRATLCLSRHEGFGFTPYEAAYFGSVPVVLNCTTYIEVSGSAFVKLRIQPQILVPAAESLTLSVEAKQLAARHVALR